MSKNKFVPAVNGSWEQLQTPVHISGSSTSNKITRTVAGRPWEPLGRSTACGNVPFRFKTAKPLAPFLITSSSHFTARSALKLRITLLNISRFNIKSSITDAIKPAVPALKLASFSKNWSNICDRAVMCVHFCSCSMNLMTLGRGCIMFHVVQINSTEWVGR
jgi:hypothetical protein